MAAPTTAAATAAELQKQKQAAPKTVPFSYQFAAGAVAGISEILIMYPLDVVKTRIQLQKGQGTGQEAYKGMLDCFGKIVRNEGFSRLYRGITAPIMMEVPKRATKFAANDEFAKFYKSVFHAPTLTQSLAILTGASAGATEAFVVVPFELVKIRLQDKAQAAKYSSPLDCAMKIIRHEGPLTLYQGLESTIWRHIVWNAGYFGCIFQVRELLPKPVPKVTVGPDGKETTGQVSKWMKMRNDLIAGSVGGTVGTLLNTPLDVVKSRIQNSVKVPGVTPKYNWAFGAVATVYREEGFRALYKGIVPKVLRFCPGGGILLVVYAETLDFFVRLRGA